MSSRGCAARVFHPKLSRVGDAYGCPTRPNVSGRADRSSLSADRACLSADRACLSADRLSPSESRRVQGKCDPSSARFEGVAARSQVSKRGRGVSKRGRGASKHVRASLERGATSSERGRACRSVFERLLSEARRVRSDARRLPSGARHLPSEPTSLAAMRDLVGATSDLFRARVSVSSPPHDISWVVGAPKRFVAAAIGARSTIRAGRASTTFARTAEATRRSRLALVRPSAACLGFGCWRSSLSSRRSVFPPPTRRALARVAPCGSKARSRACGSGRGECGHRRQAPKR